MNAEQAVEPQGRTVDEHEGSEPEPDQGWTTAEKATFVVSVVVVLGLAAIAVFAHFLEPSGGMPVIEVTIAVDEAERQDDAYAIPFSISNVGARGASELTVRFEVTDSEGAAVDEITITIADMPVQGVEDGLLLISADPATHQITARVETLLLP